MKTVPILAITNALALALAIFVYVKQGETQTASRRSEGARSESAEIAQLKMEIEDLKRANAARGYAPEAASDAPTLPSRAGPAPHEGVNPEPLASQPPEEAADPAMAGSEEFNPQEMEVFRKKVRKANEMNDAEEEVKRVTDRLDELVKENRIAPLNPRQKEAVATTVIAYRKRIPMVWQKLRASGTLENTTNEDRGRIMRAEFETLRTEAQRELEQIMPAADAKTYLDDSMRETMRGGLGGGFGGRPPQAPSTPVQGR